MDTTDRFSRTLHQLAIALHGLGAVSPAGTNLHMPDHPTRPGTMTKEAVGWVAVCMRRIQMDEGIAKEVDVPPIDSDEILVAVAPGSPAGVPYAKELKRLCGSSMAYLGLDWRNGTVTPVGTIPLSLQKVIVVDDEARDADQFLQLFSVLGYLGLDVRSVLVAIDHEQGTKEELADWRCRLLSVFTVRDLTKLLADTGHFEASDCIGSPVGS